MQPEQNPKAISLENALKNHFVQGGPAQPNSQLFYNILGRLEVEKELRALRPKVWIAAALFLGSLILLIAAFNSSWQAFGQTHTASYFWLIFSDFKTVVSNWQDYALSVLETLPLGALSFLLGSAVASLFLIGFGARQIKNFRKISQIEHLHSH